MSIAFETAITANSIQRSAFMHHMSSFFGVFKGDRRLAPLEVDVDDDSSSSSIGKNSDLSSDAEDSGDDCEESQVPRGPLDTMADLEEVLPIKRGISKFYTGKSKSFTSLADASSASSVEDLVKPENPYTRKRKNLLARGNSLSDKNNTCPPNKNTSCTTKKPSHGYAINCPESSNVREESQSRSSLSSSSCRPPLHPHQKPSLVYGTCSSPPRRNSPWRSFSLSDLQSAAGNCND